MTASDNRSPASLLDLAFGEFFDRLKAAFSPREIDMSREESLALWGSGEPVEIVTYRHSSLCATTATGHAAPCTCGGDRG